MPRGIPWDDLTLFREKKADVAPVIHEDKEPEPRDFQKDAYQIGKRALFGLVVRASLSSPSLTPLSPLSDIFACKDEGY